MKGREGSFVTGLIIGLIIVLLAAILAIKLTNTRHDLKYSKYKSEAIEHGCAEYDSKTGEWRWK